jgi:hypothetical protein
MLLKTTIRILRLSKRVVVKRLESVNNYVMNPSQIYVFCKTLNSLNWDVPIFKQPCLHIKVPMWLIKFRSSKFKYFKIAKCERRVNAWNQYISETRRLQCFQRPVAKKLKKSQTSFCSFLKKTRKKENCFEIFRVVKLFFRCHCSCEAHRRRGWPAQRRLTCAVWVLLASAPAQSYKNWCFSRSSPNGYDIWRKETVMVRNCDIFTYSYLFCSQDTWG